jgi:hypothetical protein
MINVTGKRLTSGGSCPSHITHLRWNEPSTGNGGVSPRSDMVGWIDNGVVATVHNPYGTDATCRTVHPQYGAPYVQTKPDNTTADNLLSLPDC